MRHLRGEGVAREEGLVEARTSAEAEASRVVREGVPNGVVVRLLKEGVVISQEPDVVEAELLQLKTATSGSISFNISAIRNSYLLVFSFSRRNDARKTQTLYRIW